MMVAYLRRRLPVQPWCALLWIGAVASVAGMALFLTSSWDLEVYQQAMSALRNGLDPYATGQARQTAEHALGHHAFTYVYPPLTMVLLRVLNHVPSLPGRLLYWLIYAAGFGGQLWAGYQLALPSERKLLRYLLPLIAFFPGFMPSDVIMSGNIAIPLYGAVMVGAIRGWKQERWTWFYLAVLAASLFKLPMLSLLAIPVLIGGAEFGNSALAAAGGVSLFFMQRVLWPKELAEYLTSVQLQFIYNQDFGYSAAGVLGRSLEAMGEPFTAPSTVFYLIYGAVVFLSLASLSRMYLKKQFDGAGWVTVLLTGAILLNPRIKEYDALAVTVPMVLLVMRGWRDAIGRWYLLAGATAAGCAYMANQVDAGNALWMALVFVVGVSGLLKAAREAVFVALPEAEAVAVSEVV